MENCPYITWYRIFTSLKLGEVAVFQRLPRNRKIEIFFENFGWRKHLIPKQPLLNKSKKPTVGNIDEWDIFHSGFDPFSETGDICVDSGISGKGASHSEGNDPIQLGIIAERRHADQWPSTKIKVEKFSSLASFGNKLTLWYSQIRITKHWS